MNECNIRTIMATGDNVLTAISVARQCKMLNPQKEVFLADLEQVGNKKKVVWRSQPPAYRGSAPQTNVETQGEGESNYTRRSDKVDNQNARLNISNTQS